MYGIPGHLLGEKKSLEKVERVPLEIACVCHLLKCLWNLLQPVLRSLLWLLYLPRSHRLLFSSPFTGGASTGTAAPGPGGVPQVGETRVYRPWGPQDWIAWSQETPRVREDPEEALQVVKGMLRPYDPTWGDVQMLLGALFALRQVHPP